MVLLGNYGDGEGDGKGVKLNNVKTEKFYVHEIKKLHKKKYFVKIRAHTNFSCATQQLINTFHIFPDCMSCKYRVPLLRGIMQSFQELYFPIDKTCSGRNIKKGSKEETRKLSRTKNTWRRDMAQWALYFNQINPLKMVHKDTCSSCMCKGEESKDWDMSTLCHSPKKQQRCPSFNQSEA